MQQKTITVVIDEKGNSSVDLDGFAGQGCEKALKDLQGTDRMRVERRKAAYYAQASAVQDEHHNRGQ